MDVLGHTHLEATYLRHPDFLVHPKLRPSAPDTGEVSPLVMEHTPPRVIVEYVPEQRPGLKVFSLSYAVTSRWKEGPRGTGSKLIVFEKQWCDEHVLICKRRPRTC